MSSQQVSRQKQDTGVLPIQKVIQKTRLISKNIYEKMSYFEIKTPSFQFSAAFEDVTAILSTLVTNQIQGDQLKQSLQEVELKIKYLNFERNKVSQKQSEIAFGHMMHMIDIYQNSNDTNQRYISFYLMKIWIKNLQYSDQYVDSMLKSIDDNEPFQNEIFSFLQELTVEKPDVLDKVLTISNKIIQNLQPRDQNQTAQESSQNLVSQQKNTNGKSKSQEEMLEFILNILQKFESQQLEKELVSLIQRYIPQNQEAYHQVVLQSFLNNEENFEKYFNLCVEFLKKGLESEDSALLNYIKKTDLFYQKIKTTNRRGDFIKTIICPLLFLRYTRNQDIIKFVRTLWKPTIFSDNEGQQKIVEHLEDIIQYLASKFICGEEEKILMAVDSLTDIIDKVLKDSSEIEKIDQKINILNNIQMGCFMNKMTKHEKVISFYNKFSALLNLNKSLSVQALFRGEFKNHNSLDVNTLIEQFEKKEIDLKVDLQKKFNQFTCSTFLLFLLNKQIMNDEIDQKFKTIPTQPIGLYRTNHNTIHGFLSIYYTQPYAKSILESNLIHYFKLERLSQLQSLEQFFGQEYIKNLIKNQQNDSVNLQTYLKQTAALNSQNLNVSQESKNKILKEYGYISFDEKRNLFANANIPLPTYQQITIGQNNSMEIEESQKQVQNAKNISQQTAQQTKNPQNVNQQNEGSKQQQSLNQQQKPQQKVNPQTPQQTNPALQKNQPPKTTQKLNPPAQQPQIDQQKKVNEKQEVQQQQQQNQSNVQSQQIQKPVTELDQGVEKMQIEKTNDQKNQNSDEKLENQKKNPQLPTLGLQQQKSNPNDKPKIPPKLQQVKIGEKQEVITGQQNEQNTKEQQSNDQSQQPEKMDIEQENNTTQQKQIQGKPPTLSTNQNQTTPNLQRPQTPNLETKKPEMVKPSLQGNTPSLSLGGIKPALGQQKTQGQASQVPTLGQQKQQNPTLQPQQQNTQKQQSNNQQQQGNIQTQQTNIQQQQTENKTQTNNEAQQNQSTGNPPTLSLQNKNAPALSLREKTLLKLKQNKKDDTPQNNNNNPQQAQIEKESTDNTISEEQTSQPTQNVPTLGIKPQQQTAKSSEQLDKPQQENKPSLDQIKKPSLVSLAKKKAEGQASLTPSNSSQTLEKTEAEAPKSDQNLKTSSQQSLDKAAFKPALGLKPKMAQKSNENLSQASSSPEKKKKSPVKSIQELQNKQQQEEGEVIEEGDASEQGKVVDNDQNKNNLNQGDKKDQEDQSKQNKQDNQNKEMKLDQNETVREDDQIQQKNEEKQSVNDETSKNNEQIEDEETIQEESKTEGKKQQENSDQDNQQEQNTEENQDMKEEVDEGEKDKIEIEEDDQQGGENKVEIEQNLEQTNEQENNIDEQPEVQNEEKNEENLVEEDQQNFEAEGQGASDIVTEQNETIQMNEESIDNDKQSQKQAEDGGSQDQIDEEEEQGEISQEPASNLEGENQEQNQADVEVTQEEQENNQEEQQVELEDAGSEQNNDQERQQDQENEQEQKDMDDQQQQEEVQDEQDNQDPTEDQKEEGEAEQN